MYKSLSTGPNRIGYVESDPSGRYGRFNEVLGEGAMKTVYRAFDEVLGMEVAWNQVKLKEAFHSPDLLQRLYSEVHLLKNLNHCSIIRFHTHWIDINSRSFNFITEMFTSGTLREYRRKYQQVDIRAVKNWARQILCGLAYLHEHDPPVIHRDLKCDNIFVNGHLGQVKIGDLGLAAILQGSQQAHSVIGTPEFMAPELYEEEYNELVDIYSFGMCVLEMLTSEYPYSECSNPAQIYKKVTSGKLPQVFYRIQDKELQQFVERCIGPASKRSSARELLLDPFLSPESLLSGGTLMGVPPLRSKDMTITGTMNSEDDAIFLKVQITDQDGQSNNIYFPFDIVQDTAIDVANEMVKELEICGWEPMEISKMIEEQITSLLPGWKQFGSPQFHDQLSFNYQEEEEEEEEEDDVNITPCPLYSDSLYSSSSSSLPPLNPLRETQDLHGLGAISSHDCWLQGNLYIDDDEKSTNSSLSPFMYSNINYASDYEDKYEFNSRGENPQWISKMGRKDMYRQGSLTKMDSQRNHGRNSSMRNPSKVQSFVDVRSQLLHWSLVEKISERRQFKTVGGIENVGFRQP